MRIRALLFLVVAIVLIPGFLAAAIAVEKVKEGERQAALRGLSETVRATSLLVDGEVQRSLGALTALANSVYLDTGNFQGFYEQAKAIDQPPSVWTLLLDQNGQQLLNTAVPLGTPMPAPTARETVAQVLATRKPVVTDLRIGPVTGKRLITIYSPAITPQGKRYVVAQAFSVDHWTKTALQPQVRPDWVVAVIDRHGKFIARSQRTQELLGQPARPELVAAAAASHGGLIRHKTLEGVDAYDAFTHSAQTGWTIAVAAPVETIEASARQAVSWLSAGVTIGLAAAAAVALILGRNFIRAIDAASKAARALGNGEQPVAPRTALHEVNLLNDSLMDAGRLLAAERRSREALEAERQSLLDNETKARQAAQAQNAAKDQFLALLGHELRNPLAAISGATAILVRGHPDAAESKRYLAMIQRQNHHLTHIINELLDASRMLMGKIVLEKKVLNLAACVRTCVEALRTTERAAGYSVLVDAQDVWVMGDPVRIEQILNNLLTNALKYSHTGSEIQVRVRSDFGQAIIEITDLGAGISDALMPHIFEPFVQGPVLHGRAPGGLGVGLSLVKQLVELHGGRVQARSDGEGKGSVFTVTLPSISPPAHHGQAIPFKTRASGRRVLLVEDNPDTMAATAELLRVVGYEVVEARDGDEALEAAASRHPDVIVMDIGLPGKNGFQVAAELRQSALSRHVPLIALSGYGDHPPKTEPRSGDFDAYLVKPIDPDQLVNVIEATMEAGVPSG
ncbi:MAG: hybrid sensor histidine kinase/response regulator [Rubrivivax sp.]|nr:MAG: hybrid sensor histidine kinase/response regulator [Rubrivivax sp.]